MRSQKNRWRLASDGRPVGSRPSCEGVSVVLIIIMALGLCHCAENPRTTPASAPPGPSPPSLSQLERAKMILGVTDHPLTDSASPAHPQNIKKILTLMRKGFLAKKPLGPKASQDSSKSNQGLIRNILKAVSDIGGGGTKEIEKEIEEEQLKAEDRELLPKTHDSVEAGEERSKGKEKLVKVISEGVLTKEYLLPEHLETPMEGSPPTEEESMLVMEDQANKERITASSAVENTVLNNAEGTKLTKQKKETVLKQRDTGVDGGGDDDDSKREMDGREVGGGSETQEIKKNTGGKKRVSGRKETDEECRKGTEKETIKQETVESEKTETKKSYKMKKEKQTYMKEEEEVKNEEKKDITANRKEGKNEETGGTTTATAEKEKEDVQPLGSGVEVVTKALGVLDVKVSSGLGNTSISPAPVVDGRQNILTKKTDVTLSHILGAKEFFNSLPNGNFTSLRTPKSWASYSQLSHKASTTQKSLPHHKTEKKEVSEPVKEQTVADGVTVPADIAKEKNTLSTATEAQKTEDEAESQKTTDAEASVATEVTEETDTPLAETNNVQQTEVDEDTVQQKEKYQVESTKEEQPSEAPAGNVEAGKESAESQETTKSATAEVEVVTEEPQTASVQSTEEKVTKEAESPQNGPAVQESRNETEEGARVEGESEAVAGVSTDIEEVTDKEAKVYVEEEKAAAVVLEAEEEKDKPITEADTTEEVTKKKKKSSEPEKTKKKDGAEKTADAKVGEREKTSDTLETYSQFTQRVNAEKKNDIVSNGHGSNGHGKGPKVKSKNYASPDCGSKLLTANPEATHASKVINANKDEYLLNKCRDKTWFIIELCESIRPQKFDIANFELFSNLPKDIHVLGSHRYPSRDWTPLARARAQEGNRGVQSFPIEMEDFFKYIKVEVHSHYGSEFFCPISLFRIYGLSEFEVIDTAEEPEEPEEPEEVFIDAQPEKNIKEEGKPSVIPAVIKNMFSGVLDVIKRGYRPHSASSEPGDSCYSLHPRHAVDKMTCQLADSLNYILSCYHAEYQVLMRRPFVSQIVKNSGFCRLLASTMCLMPEVSDSVVYDTACNSSYLCIMLSPKHVLAMCFMHDGRIMDSQVACESDSDTLLPENFSATTATILPPENGIPPYVKNAKINTSTITRTDNTVSSLSGALTPDSKDKSAKQFPVNHDSVSSEKPMPSEAPDVSAADVSKPKKVKATGGSQEKRVKEAEQPDNTTEPEEGTQAEGSGIVGLELTEEEGAKEEEEKQEEEVPGHVMPLPVEPKVSSSTSPTNKESVVVRLSNKIKALEYNMSISSQYLEELSRRYKRQMEEMQRQFNLTIAALNATSRQAFERDQQHQRDIETLERQLASVSDILGKLVEERQNLAHTVVEQHLLLMVVEVVVLCVVFVLCHKRTSRDRFMQLEGQDRRAQTPSEDPSDRQALGSNSSNSWSRGRVRRRSVDSITRERSGLHRRCRRPSEEALRISGTYEDLLIIEPTIPIMVDSVSDRKKKKKSSSGTLKRSKSNASIVEKSYSSTSKRALRRIETLDMSSAGVLFCGDQVEAKEAPSTSQRESASTHIPSSAQEPPDTAAIISRPYVEEVIIDGHPQSGTQTSKRHSFPCSQNRDIVNKKGLKLSKSHSVSCASEKLKNGADKKKVKKLKKKNFSQESHQYIQDSEFCPEVNGASYNGHGEHVPEYYYNGRNSVHFSESTSTLSNHVFNVNILDGNIYANGDDSVDQGYVGSDYMHSSYASGYSDRQRTTPVPKVKLRSDNWEWYSLQHFGSSSETVSTCSDSSSKVRKGKHDEMPHMTHQSDDKKAKKKKKSKSKGAAVLEEETKSET